MSPERVRQDDMTVQVPVTEPTHGVALLHIGEPCVPPDPLPIDAPLPLPPLPTDPPEPCFPPEPGDWLTAGAQPLLATNAAKATDDATSPISLVCMKPRGGICRVGGGLV